MDINELYRDYRFIPVFYLSLLEYEDEDFDIIIHSMYCLHNIVTYDRTRKSTKKEEESELQVYLRSLGAV